MKSNTIVFGSNLKEIRKKAGLSRAQLAEKISYSEKAIEKWESGSSMPPVTTVCKLADFFGITVDSLLYTSKTDVRYLLGIDGGATKTVFLLTEATEDKREIARVVLGPSNPVDIGIDNVKAILDQGIRQVCSGINMRQVAMFAGLSGGTAGDNKAQINVFLSQFDFAFFDNANDMFNALELALNGEDGVVIAMRTGIIAYSQFEGKLQRIAGWGPHIDKGGSGYNFGSDALDAAFKYIDGRKGSRIIKDLVEDRLKKPLTESIPDIYRVGKACVASFAPVVFEAYAQGDDVAANIIDSNVKEVARIITAGLNFIGNNESKVVICGSLCHQENILRPFLYKYLGSDINLNFTDERMVNGAVMVAGKLAESKENEL